MPASKKSKKRRKGKKGKKGKKEKIVPEPLPLHSLTDIYKKIDDLVRQLWDARIVSRKKRKEAELFQNEIEALKRDDAVYKEHLQDLLNEIRDSILDFQKRLEQERESIKKEIAKIFAELDKKLEATRKRIEESEKRIEELRKSLKELQPLMDMVADLLAKLADLNIELEKLTIEVAIKTRHLKNQYLVLRAELFNYLQEQLETLITKIREYLMPIIWEHMHRLEMQNRCHRWDLLQKDEKNFKLHVVRDDLIKQLDKLDGEEPYFGCEWVFERLNEEREKLHEERLRWKRRLQEVFKNRNLTQHYKKKVITTVEKAPNRVETDFREYLRQRLQAIEAAKQRQAKIERQQERRQRKAELELKQQEAARKKATFTKPRKSADTPDKSIEAIKSNTERDLEEKIEPKDNEIELEGKTKSDKEIGATESIASIKSAMKISESKVNLKDDSLESSTSEHRRVSNAARRSITTFEEEEE